MADGSRLAELAMKAGEMGAREDVPDDVRALLAEFVAELAGGPVSVDPAMAKEPITDPAKPDAPAMREEDMPPKMRAQARGMARMHASTLESMIRMRVHELRTVDGLTIDPAIETRLRKAPSIEDFEDRLELVKVSLGSANGQRARSRVVSEGTEDTTHGHSVTSLTKAGHSADMAGHIVAEFKRSKEFGDVALKSAMKFRRGAKNGNA